MKQGLLGVFSEEHPPSEQGDPERGTRLYLLSTAGFSPPAPGVARAAGGLQCVRAGGLMERRSSNDGRTGAGDHEQVDAGLQAAKATAQPRIAGAHPRRRRVAHPGARVRQHDHRRGGAALRIVRRQHLRAASTTNWACCAPSNSATTPASRTIFSLHSAVIIRATSRLQEAVARIVSVLSRHVLNEPELFRAFVLAGRVRPRRAGSGRADERRAQGQGRRGPPGPPGRDPASGPRARGSLVLLRLYGGASRAGHLRGGEPSCPGGFSDEGLVAEMTRMVTSYLTYDAATA